MNSDGFLSQVFRTVSRQTSAFGDDYRAKVAAELRRLAAEFDALAGTREALDTGQVEGLRRAARHLRGRVIELDPQGVQS